MLNVMPMRYGVAESLRSAEKMRRHGPSLKVGEGLGGRKSGVDQYSLGVGDGG